MNLSWHSLFWTTPSLLVGLVWPLVYFVQVSKAKGLILYLKWFSGLEVLALLLTTMYLALIWLKGSLTLGDSVFLFGICALYILELSRLRRVRKQEAINFLICLDILQWTVLGALIPITYSVWLRAATPIFFDPQELHVVGLTVVQSLFALLVLMDLEIGLWDALALFVLWAIQLFIPSLAISAYAVCIAIEVIFLVRKKKFFYALVEYRKQKELCAKTNEILPS